MTRKLLVLSLVLLALALAVTAPRGAAAEESLQRVLDAGVLRIGAEPNPPPMLFKSGARYDGFDWAVANALAKRIGVDTVVVVPGKYSELPGRLIADKFDVIVSGYTADPSIPGVDWSESYYDYGLCLVVRKGSGVRTVDDLAGKVVGLFNDPAAEQDVRRLVRGAKAYEKYEDGYFDLLAAGKIDGFVYDFPYAQEELKEYRDRLEIVQFNLTQSSYNVGVRRGATSLLKMVNAAIRELKGSEEYRQIIRKYLGGTGPAPIAKVAGGQSVYKVRPGDTLSRISRDQLGQVNRWYEIWELNKGRIADPNLIEVGWELLLPSR